MTWGNRFNLYTPWKGTAGAPQVYNVWGTLVASFMTDEDHPGTTCKSNITSSDIVEILN
jgi:hypothetical protein